MKVWIVILRNVYEPDRFMSVHKSENSLKAYYEKQGHVVDTKDRSISGFNQTFDYFQVEMN
jgi:hypothetical protein